MKKLRLAVITIGVLMGLSQPASAIDCGVTLTNLFAGDSGVLIVYSTGGNAFMSSSDVNFKQVFSILTAALISNKTPIAVRISGSSCTATGQTLLGVWWNL